MGKTKKKNNRIVLILVFSLAVLAVLAFFAMRKIGGGSFSFSREERFFLNGKVIGKTEGEITSIFGQPDHITEIAGNYIYRDFNLLGMTGEFAISFRNGQADYTQWAIGNIDVDDYWPQIDRLTSYFNKNYNQVDTWDWRRDDIHVSITGVDWGNFLNVFFQ